MATVDTQPAHSNFGEFIITNNNAHTEHVHPKRPFFTCICIGPAEDASICSSDQTSWKIDTVSIYTGMCTHRTCQQARETANRHTEKKTTHPPRVIMNKLIWDLLAYSRYAYKCKESWAHKHEKVQLQVVCVCVCVCVCVWKRRSIDTQTDREETS